MTYKEEKCLRYRIYRYFPPAAIPEATYLVGMVLFHLTGTIIKEKIKGLEKKLEKDF